MNKAYFVIISFLILLISLHDIKAIPFYKIAGLDFSNNYGFHHCEESSESIYKIEPIKCADYEARPYVYPPLLYQMFSWTKFFSTAASAYSLFLFLHVISFFFIIYVWADKNLWSLLFGAGLFFTYPNLFLVERGNSDIFIVAIWSLAYLCYQKNKLHWAGALSAIAVFAKLYPLYSVIILAAYYYNKNSEKKLLLQSFVFTAFVIVLISPFFWFEYITSVLPAWSGIKLPVFNLAHSFKSIPIPALGSILFLLLVASWIIAAHKSNANRIHWIWAGGLAVSTFNNGVSYDYNLVTIFPLAIVGFNYLSQKNHAKILAFWFLALFFAAFGFRDLLADVSVYPLIRLYLLAFAMIGIPFTFFDLSHEMKRISYYFKVCSKKYS